MKNTILQYNRLLKHQYRAILLVTIFLAVAVGWALSTGPVHVSLLSIFAEGQATARKIFMSIRLPRVLAAVLAGAGLSVSGLVMQNVLRNSLASPFTLGISGASAFGAAFSIVVMGNTIASLPAAKYLAPFISNIFALLFSLISVLLIITIMKKRGSRPAIIVLAGIMISSLFSACTSALQYFASDRQLAEIIFWTFGDPGRADYTLLMLQALIIVPVIIWMTRHTWDFVLLQSGDDSASAGGMDPYRFRLTILVLASLVTSVIVAGYGIISFVGLVAPHICRYFIRGQWLTIAASALFGGLFLLVSDTLARFILQPVILPVGIVTAFFGAPFFIIMLFLNKGLK